jgi:hypothetical protein
MSYAIVEVLCLVPGTKNRRTGQKKALTGCVQIGNSLMIFC